MVGSMVVVTVTVSTAAGAVAVTLPWAGAVAVVVAPGTFVAVGVAWLVGRLQLTIASQMASMERSVRFLCIFSSHSSALCYGHYPLRAMHIQ
jgi:hypothetical protein